MTQTKLKLEEGLKEAVAALNSLKEDEGLPKNIKAKIDSIIAALAEHADISSSIGKSLLILDEIAEDLNIQPFIRTQVWGISSMLEKLNN